ncbi:MAG: Fe2+-dependent dioxygenase [Synechococcus sp. ArSW.bin.68]|jgi:PKHD-type hydroxylase
MNHLRLQILDQANCERLLERLASEAEWRDGSLTAGAHAKGGKRNSQINYDSPLREEIHELVERAMWNHPVVKGFCLPRKLHRFLITKTEKEGGYDTHVDNAYMSSGRSDLSFTFSLTDEKSYEGGELEIDSLSESFPIKLKQGEIVIYPSTSLHRVCTVTTGVRTVCVGWIESYVKGESDRISLFQLESGARAMLSKHGRSDELDLIFLAYTNLLRRLGG